MKNKTKNKEKGGAKLPENCKLICHYNEDGICTYNEKHICDGYNGIIPCETKPQIIAHLKCNECNIKDITEIDNANNRLCDCPFICNGCVEYYDDFVTKNFKRI